MILCFGSYVRHTYCYLDICLYIFRLSIAKHGTSHRAGPRGLSLKRGTGNWELGTGNGNGEWERERGMGTGNGNGEWGMEMGNWNGEWEGERGMGNGERESGNN